MPAPVTRVTIHHQGVGVPRNGAWAGSEPYCALIGTTLVTVVQPPWTAYATKFHNHESFDVCLSGDRMVCAVTDTDLALIAKACADARARGWLAQVATTFPHGTLYPPPALYPSGSSPTQCPGILTVDRWPALVAATRTTAPLQPPGADMPADTDVVDAYSSGEGAWVLEYSGGVRTLRGAFYGSYFTLPDKDRNDPARRFLTICAPTDGVVHGYALVSTKGEPYNFHTPQ
jgi:hypothetical protein